MNQEERLTTRALQAALTAVVDRISTSRQELCALDAVAGDGDLGVTLATGFTAVRPLLENTSSDDAGDLLIRVGMELGRKASSTMGTLLGTAFMRAGAQVRGKSALTVADIATLFEAARDGIGERGRVEVGQRTVLDAMAPAAAAARAAAEQGLSAPAALRRAAEAAIEGAAATSEMEPRVGRAGWLADRARGHRDAGAVAWATITDALASAVATTLPPGR